MRPGLIVLIAALGYFVDVFDVVLFSGVRTQSLQDLGLSGESLLTVGVQLLNAQMIGMLLGGILWGVIGDRIGRVQTLFGSILLYSVANIANGFVSSVEAYKLLRFITGVGLAGEIGGAITLVSEVLSKERRGIGTAIVATAGAVGAVAASYSVTIISWRSLYIIGGVMGLLLLALRLATAESRVFESVKSDSTVRRGSLSLLVTNRGRLARLLALIAIGLPHYFSWAIVATFSPEIAEASIGKRISGVLPLSYFALGITVGDIFCGLFSQLLRSRKKAIGIFLISQSFCVFGALHLNGSSETLFTMWFLPLGFFCGLWSVLITSASEQYGTNLRSTVSSIVPNAVRGCTVPLSIAFLSCKEYFGSISAVQIVSGCAFLLAFVGLKIIRESFGIPLNYIEVIGGQRDYEELDSSRAQVSDAPVGVAKELRGGAAAC